MSLESEQIFIDLNHVMRADMTTYPGLRSPAITAHLTPGQSAAVYDPGIEFMMDIITIIGKTGTSLDSPHHRFAAGADLAELPIRHLMDLPAVVLRIVNSPERAVDAASLASLGDVHGCAVLINSGDDKRFGTPAYARDPAFVTQTGAQWLVDQGAVLVGIDSMNIDDATDATQPAHTLLLGAGIPIVEHLTALDKVPDRGAWFTAIPPRVANVGTFPVRAFATVVR